MADPMTNVEIEDVLSSIRRLVADGGATAPVVPRVPKLVLTQAQRIDTAEDATVDHAAVDDAPVHDAAVHDGVPERAPVAAAPLMVQPAVAQTANTDAGGLVADRLRLMATIAELEAAVRAQGDASASGGTGMPPDLDWAPAGFEAPDGDVDVAVLPVTAPMDATAWPATLVEAARRYGDAGDAATPGAGDAGDGATFRHHRMPPPASTPRHGAGGRQTGDAVQPDGITASGAPVQDDTTTPEDQAAWQDDLIGGPDLGPDPEDDMHHYLSGAALTDPDALRALVAQIVREELQGQLGVKITRNVRKLVRSEIQRILTTETFD